MNTPERARRSAELKRYKEHAARFSAFCAEWTPRLLLDYAPRIAKLNDRRLTRELGKCLAALSEPWSPSMSHLDKCAARLESTMTDEILVELLIEDVKSAERSRR